MMRLKFNIWHLNGGVFVGESCSKNKVVKVIVLGHFPRDVMDALWTQGVEVQQPKEPILLDPLMSASPYAMQSYIDLHPNDNWRGKGKRKRTFR